MSTQCALFSEQFLRTSCPFFGKHCRQEITRSTSWCVKEDRGFLHAACKQLLTQVTSCPFTCISYTQNSMCRKQVFAGELPRSINHIASVFGCTCYNFKRFSCRKVHRGLWKQR